MYNKLLSMYQRGLLTEVQLQKAVEKGWISEEEKIQIILSKQE